MNQMEMFKNSEFGSVRVIEENGKYLFCGTDVAKALGYARPNEAVSKRCKGTLKRRTPTTGGIQEMLFIPEGDVYRTASGNVLPYAKPSNDGLFCVKDFCNHGHIGSYTLVTPQGKLHFAGLRDSILLMI